MWCIKSKSTVRRVSQFPILRERSLKSCTAKWSLKKNNELARECCEEESES